MSRILCAKSGIQYHVDFMPLKLNLTSGECHHPMFDASYNQLLALVDEYRQGNLDNNESYLLYLSLFNSTELVEFRTNAKQNENTNAIVTSNIYKLVSIVDRIQYATAERARSKFLMPTYVISHDTNDLSNTKYWIQNWESCYIEYKASYKPSTELARIQHMENILETYIKDKTKDISQYASQLANWACIVGKFKEIDCVLADGSNNDRPISLVEYWTRIIKTCAQKANVYEIHDEDLNELIRYLETNIEIASSGIFGHTLIALLNSVRKTKELYFSIGDVDIGVNGTIYKILDADASVEDANKLVLIDSAPTKEPILTDYPSRFHYLKAKMKYDMAQRYKTSDNLRLQMEQTIVDIAGLGNNASNASNANNANNEEI